jgi:hypothetical protein
MTNAVLVPPERIESKIYVIRGIKVMLDRDLAELYGTSTSRLNQQVKRNAERFPEDFMFSLTKNEIDRISQIVTSSKSIKFSKNINVFTEQGVAMLSGVINSSGAIQINIAIMRAFVKMRDYLSEHKKVIDKLKKHDENFVIIFNVLKELMEKPKASQKKYGFKV